MEEWRIEDREKRRVERGMSERRGWVKRRMEGRKERAMHITWGKTLHGYFGGSGSYHDCTVSFCLHVPL